MEEMESEYAINAEDSVSAAHRPLIKFAVYTPYRHCLLALLMFSVRDFSYTKGIESNHHERKLE